MSSCDKASSQPFKNALPKLFSSTIKTNQTPSIENAARATDIRVRKKFNGCLDALASHLHFFPSCSSASWQHSNENGRYAAILRDGVGISETNEGLTSDQEASLRRSIQMRFLLV